METAIQVLRFLTELSVLGGVVWQIIKSHDNGMKIDVLTTQINGMAKKLEEGDRAIGAADARREDRAEASHILPDQRYE